MRDLFGYDSRCFAHSATYLDPAAAGFYNSDSLGEFFALLRSISLIRK